MPVNILSTKLHQPKLSARWVLRQRLIERLNEGLASGCQLTLVSAPAGFGKSACVSEWVNNQTIRPIAWLSLDPADDDPQCFFAYFVAALQKVDPGIGHDMEGVMKAGQVPPVELLVTTLLNDIQAIDRPFILVLDDFQGIKENSILQAIQQLLGNQPGSMHLVIITREDPQLALARMRAHHQLTEIRAVDLRFTNGEASQFLNEVLGVCLSQTDITLLQDQVEGWIAGLQLAGLSIRDRRDPSRFITNLSGSNRFILGYLTEEVLSRQTEDTQRFLLQTAGLDRLCGDLCNQVTGRTDSQTVLEQLFNANLFLFSLDDAQCWYRYHHLFADLLRNRQTVQYKDQIAELHRRASQWFAQAGMPHEAIGHALSAADYATAVRLLETEATRLLIQGYSKTVEDWMQAIPVEWRSQSPKANLAFAWKHFFRGEIQQVLPYVERLQSISSTFEVEKKGQTSLKAEWLALQSMLLVGQGKPEDSLALAHQALLIVPDEDGYVRSLIYMGMAGAYQQLDDFDRSVEVFQKIIHYGQSGENAICEILGISGLIQMALQHGKYRLAFQVASRGVDRVERLGLVSPISAAVYGALGQVYYQWHQIEKIHDYYLHTIQLSKFQGYSDAEIGYSMMLSHLGLMEGNLEKAHREIQKALHQMEVTAPAWVREEVISQQIRVYLGLDRLADAEAALEHMQAPLRTAIAGSPWFAESMTPGISSSDRHVESQILAHLPDKITLATGLLYNSALRILLFRAQAKPDALALQRGVFLAEHLIQRALQGQFIQIALETLLLRAQMNSVLKNEPACLSDYARALTLAEPENYISLFIEEGWAVAAALTVLLKNNLAGTVRPEYIQSILAAFAKFHPQFGPELEQPALDGRILPITKNGAQELVEPLTDREMDVLRLIAEGLKYEEIAGKLFISLNTVRTYVKAIYSKLNVNSRAKAVLLARHYQIL